MLFVFSQPALAVPAFAHGGDEGFPSGQFELAASSIPSPVRVDERSREADHGEQRADHSPDKQQIPLDIPPSSFIM